jgi:hypothetical protein
MSTAVQVERCPRCGIQKPFYCACDQTVDAEGGFSIYVHGLAVVEATTPDKTPKPTEHFLVLEGQHEFSKTEYRFKAEDAKRLGQLIIDAAEELLKPDA